MTKRKQTGYADRAMFQTGRNLTLRSLFPQYRDSMEVQREIEASPSMSATFHSWNPSRREEFLDFCCGNRGVRILYDSFFKYVFDPSSGQKELSRLISVLLGQEVRSLRILPNESHLGADYTLVIMDIIVETGDGSIVNVEVQKIGYRFPGERAACYNADLLLRQYQRIRKDYAADVSSDNRENRSELRRTDSAAQNAGPGNSGPGIGALDSGENRTDGTMTADTTVEIDRKNGSSTGASFSYKYIRPVYTIVFMEKSTAEFHRFPDACIHTFRPKSDTGLELNLLQNYLFIPLDIFRHRLAEKMSSASAPPLTEKEAWLAFLSSDDPQVILRLLDQFPDLFRPLYDRICTICRNTEEVMNMYSDELSILDKNTVMMMIEEQREMIEQKDRELLQKNRELSQKDQELSQKDQELSQKDRELSQKDEMIERLQKELEKERLGRKNS